MEPMTITATAKNGKRTTVTVYTVGQLMQFLHRLGIPMAAEVGTATDPYR